MGQFGIGQPVPREEDPYLLRGRGRYVDDVRQLDVARAYFLRSPHAHARIAAIDVSKAEAADGVLLVLTGEHPAVTALGLQAPRMPRKRKDGSPGFIAAQPWLARGFVRFVGEAVACVIAETLDQAKDAAELIEVEYETLPAIVSTEQAILPGALAVWEKCPDNVAFYQEWGNKAAVDAALAKADRVVRQRMIINRITANTMEPRGCLAEYDTHDDRYVIRCTIQAPHRTKAAMASLFKVPETRIRVIADNVGGGFGMKGAIFPEYILVPAAARLLGRPVKWICERSEGLLSDEHSRDNVVDAEFALDRDGHFLGLRIKTYAAIGAYHTSDRAAGPPLANVGCLSATYTTPAFHVEVSGVMTHTQLTGHYRGAGRPENAYMIETMIDLAARELGIDKAELRRRNTVPAAAMPYKTALVYTIDSGDFPKNLEQCLHMADYAGFAARREEATPARSAARHRRVEHDGGDGLGPARARRDALRCDRHAHFADGDARPRPGPCHDLQADGVRQARHRFRSHQVQVRRHRRRRHGHRHVRVALGRVRRRRDRACRRQGDRARQEDRGAPARSGRSRSRVRQGQVRRCRDRQGDRPHRRGESVVPAGPLAARHGGGIVRDRDL